MPMPIIIYLALGFLILGALAVAGGVLGVLAIGILLFSAAIRLAQFLGWIYDKCSPRPAAPGNCFTEDYMAPTNNIPTRIEIDRLIAEAGEEWVRQLDDLHIPARVDYSEIERLIRATESEYARDVVRSLAKYH